MNPKHKIREQRLHEAAIQAAVDGLAVEWASDPGSWNRTHDAIAALPEDHGSLDREFAQMVAHPAPVLADGAGFDLEGESEYGTSVAVPVDALSQVLADLNTVERLGLASPSDVNVAKASLHRATTLAFPVDNVFSFIAPTTAQVWIAASVVAAKRRKAERDLREQQAPRDD